MLFAARGFQRALTASEHGSETWDCSKTERTRLKALKGLVLSGVVGKSELWQGGGNVYVEATIFPTDQSLDLHDFVVVLFNENIFPLFQQPCRLTGDCPLEKAGRLLP